MSRPSDNYFSAPFQRLADKALSIEQALVAASKNNVPDAEKLNTALAALTDMARILKAWGEYYS